MNIRYIGRGKDLECYICHRSQIDLILFIKNELESFIKENIVIKDKIQDELTKFGYFSDVYFFNKYGENLYPMPFNFSNKLENYLFDKKYPQDLTEETLKILYTPSLEFVQEKDFEESNDDVKEVNFSEFVDLLNQLYIIIIIRTYVCYLCSETFNIVDQNSFGDWFRYLKY